MQTVVLYVRKPKQYQNIMKPKSRIKIGYLVFTLLSLYGLVSCTSSIEESNPPNIIVFLVDDMGLMDTSVPFLTDTNGNPIKYPLNDFYQIPICKC